jgi:hypothetical protein
MESEKEGQSEAKERSSRESGSWEIKIEIQNWLSFGVNFAFFVGIG